MRGGGKLTVDPCDPWGIERRGPGGLRILRVEFLPGVDGGRVRSETFELFEKGLHSRPEPPHVRPGFFGSDANANANHQYQEF